MLLHKFRWITIAAKLTGLLFAGALVRMRVELHKGLHVAA
jgi:hypothetical protein